MESLFSHRPFRKRRLFISAVAAILLECSLVGFAAIWPSYKSWKIPDPETTIDTGPVLGEQVQELIAPKEEPVPTPDQQPTPPPEDTPPPDDTPPPTDDPDMEPPPPPKKDKPPKPATKAIPPGAKRGDKPQDGVVNGNAKTAAKTTGTPGAAHLGAAGWHTPQPPYPAQARASHVTGSGSVSLATNAAGEVISAVIEQSTGNAILDHNMTSFARSNWTGPPNSTLVKPFTYRLE